ncbi:hypothetical protein OHT57_27060 [Streptomyces sp. NBC_00285]|uniref:hypothetical protein n=1 Tax=Streptomyces sp. NBC_00285 TaxID=2975700 RepID=UPI002E2E0B2B|nr:hypothetical protein [Streptomyces sp. NBC_00285]
MTTRTTFEDRLLAELREEIERRQAVPERAPTARRRLLRGPERMGSVLKGSVLTSRRLALAVAACVVAGLGVVLAPGTPAGAPAYALERHDDGTVTLTVKDQDIDVDAQRELARKLRQNGIETDVQILRPGYACKGDPVLWGIDVRGERTPLFVFQWTRKITLRRGNVLVFVNLNAWTEPYRVYVYPTEADVEPCVPVKPTPNRSQRA